MKRILAIATILAVLLAPASGFAGGRGHHRGRHSHGEAVAWGILGGFLGGVLVDRAFGPPPVVVYPRRYWAPPPSYSYGVSGGGYSWRVRETYRNRRNCGERWDRWYDYED